MTQENRNPEEKETLRLSVPKLVGIIAAVAAVTVAITLALQPKQVTTVPSDPAAQQATVTQTELATVPDVCGLERQHAEKALANARLDVGKKTEDFSETVPAGCVISQDPPAGTLANLDSKVNLVISKGRKAPEQTTMPDLIGKTREEAEKALADAKLVAVQGPNVTTDKAEPGRVCEQSVEAGTKLSQDTHVSYSIAVAPDTSVVVPNLAGESIDDARRQLTDMGLGCDTSLTYHDTVAKDYVVDQSVEAGTKVAKGTVITLGVSMGRKPSGSIEVPDVVGKTADEATATLQNAGLTVSTVEQYSTKVAKNNVMSQSIAAGTKVAKDTPVTITVSMGPREDGSVTVPDLAGKSAGDAEAKLADLGLKADRDETYSDTVAKDHVIGQSIAAGTKVAKNTVVTITVSLGTKPEPPKPEPVMVTVPDITTYNLDDALTALWSAGLAERWSGEENGTVVAQYPEAGTEVEEGTIVTFQLEHISSKVEVPDVSGLTADEAAYAMGFAGLSLDYDADQAGRIVARTDPVAGALLDEGSHVTPIFEDTEEPAQTQETKPQPETEPETDTNTDTENTEDNTDESTPEDEPTNDEGNTNGDEDNTEPEGDNTEGDEGNTESDDTNAEEDNTDAEEEATNDEGDDSGDEADDSSHEEAAADPNDMINQALENAGVNYEIVSTISTQASNDGTDYTLLCRDDTGDYHVVVHVPGTAGATASLVSVTPASED